MNMNKYSFVRLSSVLGLWAASWTVGSYLGSGRVMWSAEPPQASRREETGGTRAPEPPAGRLLASPLREAGYVPPWLNVPAHVEPARMTAEEFRIVSDAMFHGQLAAADAAARVGKPLKTEPVYADEDLPWQLTFLFRVQIPSWGDVKENARPLAEEVKKTLEATKPDNRGRRASFPYWRSTRPPGGVPIWVNPVGWCLSITSVAGDRKNWTATVVVQPLAEYGPDRVLISNYHVEYYRFDGKLRLEGEALPTKFNPWLGLTMTTKP